MNNRLRISLLVLAILCVGNVAWRVWAGWGRITIDADGAPLSTVVRSMEKQAGVRLCSNLPADTKVTMHVRKAPLLHALEVLAASTEANWSVGYFTAPDQGAINTALASLSSGGQPEGWKRFFLPGPGLRGMGGDFDQGASDPREDPWNTKPATEGTLHAYLEQASLMTSAQFWAPEQWNPGIAKPPKAGEVRDVLPRLAKSARGRSAEVFLLRGRPQMREVASDDSEDGGRADRVRDNSRRGRGGPSGEEMRKAMEERALAQIERLPKDRRDAARAEFEERRKFFQELSQLSPEERRARMEQRMDQVMNNSEAVAKMEAASTKRGAMQTAEQRADRYRTYLNRKREANN